MHRPIFLFVFSLMACLAAKAQQISYTSILSKLDTIYHAKKIIDPIKIDGLISERSWKEAQKTIYFIQNFPTDTLTSKTSQEIMVAYDEKFLYIAAKILKSVKDQPFTTPSLKRDFRGEAFDAFVVRRGLLDH